MEPKAEPRKARPAVRQGTPDWSFYLIDTYPMGVYIFLNGVAMADEKCPHCSGKHKERNESEKKDLMNRLKRIEGQVRGLEGMLENNAYCTDIIIQVSAVTSALNSFNKVLLGNHIKTCVAENIRAGNDDVIDELTQTLQKLMK